MQGSAVATLSRSLSREQCKEVQNSVEQSRAEQGRAVKNSSEQSRKYQSSPEQCKVVQNSIEQSRKEKKLSRIAQNSPEKKRAVQNSVDNYRITQSSAEQHRTLGRFLSEKDQYIKFHMFPFYYGWLPYSKTAFVCLLAQVYPEVVSFESQNGEFNEK